MNNRVIFKLAVFVLVILLGGAIIFAVYWITTAPQRALAYSTDGIINSESAEYDATINLPFEYNLSSGTFNIDLNLTGSGIVDIHDNRFTFEGNIVIPGILGGKSTTTDINIIFGNGKLYFYNSSTAKWSSIDSQKLQNQVATQSNLSNIAIPIPNLQYTGDDTIEGKPVYVYTAAVDTAPLNTALGPEIQKLADKLKSNYSGIPFSSLGVDLNNIRITFDTMTMEYKVYKDSSLPAKITVTTTMTYNFGKSLIFTLKNAQINLTLKNYNNSVTIEIPNNSTEINLNKALTISPTVSPEFTDNIIFQEI